MPEKKEAGKLNRLFKEGLSDEGLEYRHLGTMEHNICDIVALRMKDRKMSWSINGATTWPSYWLREPKPREEKLFKHSLRTV